jgi:2-oxo-4-hydroxy-4-carboxy-5-ureidoimidazoline decarboxylase
MERAVDPAPVMDAINAMSDDELHRELRECCGSERWVRYVAEYRPYADADALWGTVEAAWQHLEPEDWQQAIAALPQRDLPPADQGTQQALTLALRLYDERFGYPFIAEQEHLPAEELLMRIRIRLGQDPPAELRKTCSEICIIARRRLARLLLTSSP